jgi:hypothetical protein
VRAESKFPSALLKSVTTFPTRGIDKLKGFRTTFRNGVRKCGRKSKMDRRAQKSVAADARAGVRNGRANLESGGAHGGRTRFFQGMRIAFRGRRVPMPEQLAEDQQGIVAGSADAREGMPQIM